MPFWTGAYPAELPELLGTVPLRHRWRVTVEPDGGTEFRVTVHEDQLSVRFAAGWSPQAQADLTIKTPTAAAELSALDGRLNTYVRIALGYEMPGGGEVLVTAVRIRLHDVDEDYASHTMKLRLQGRELFYQDQYWSADWNVLIPRGGVREFIEYVLTENYVRPVLNGTGYGFRPDLVNAEDMNPTDGQSLWSIAEQVANSAGLKLWHDGLNTWHLKPRFSITAAGEQYPLALRAGAQGTLTSLRRVRSRTDWFNTVRLTYPDTLQSNGRPRFGGARVWEGPFGAARSGSRTFYRDVPGWVSQAGADRAARSLLSSLMARGDSYAAQAVAAYWLRPGMSVPVNSGRGGDDVQIVESVEFTPGNGLMSIQTIKTEDWEIG